MNVAAERGMLALFDELDATMAALERLHALKVYDLVVFTPVPRHELDHATHEPESPVRIFTLVGGLTGAAAGLALGTWTSVDWPLITGGKPIVSVPAFVVLAALLTILFGAIATVVGLLLSARLPGIRRGRIYDPSFSVATFGIHVVPRPGQGAQVRRILGEAGAKQIREDAAEVRVGTL